MPLNPVHSHGTNRNIKNIVTKKNGIVTLSSFYLVNVAVFLWPHAKGVSEQFGKMTCISIAHFESHGTDTIIRILKKQQSIVHSHDLEIFIGCRSIHLSKSHLETGGTHICGLSQFGDRKVSRQIPLHQRNSLSERSLILFIQFNRQVSPVLLLLQIMCNQRQELHDLSFHVERAGAPLRRAVLDLLKDEVQFR